MKFKNPACWINKVTEVWSEDPPNKVGVDSLKEKIEVKGNCIDHYIKYGIPETFGPPHPAHTHTLPPNNIKCDLSFIEKERFGKLGHYGCLVLPAYFKTLVMMNAYCLNKFFCAYCRATNDLQYCLFDVYF